ncbi:50S ribosomal protein L23 [Candidatus Pacearchaeota archaeon CG10_big_fil_rev_8_21_14_0_10_35_219]|nr:50S ribosomal protein L23 [Candidatus Pacearchaeota archaeon]OIO42319.1 MAG: 50S ribosomal protein L23 [Candidatus Pacearchaeota archaeon CG1_02_35_32]PIO07446.1 MAG: 50S ribosomal protein L23 [Candidatus Pacearchaeota archaeon CG10_big_fil_rev_8_21_14_0_10_35_219]PIY81252.1 MAG: 50S ribosomal protein L23 [Candidatus Pacearchaeota archaeon CG_4_10_14_0_8_um_filter_35_169]PIZ80181.1 MAG: 50S ribosomal protein L23 [Candidatus Pacearchaeota archaeon CG_4_10_14_0_2_um_filter_35_33]PJA69554.1 MA
MILKPVTSEKVVRMMDMDNTLVFEVERKTKKEEAKKEVEKVFKVKIEKIRSSIKKNKKFVYVKLKKENPAIDVATKLGMI